MNVVRPGDRVLEIGAGLGTYAFFAADAGAARVWAVDGHPVIHVAQTIARLNGYADRVTFVRGWLPEAASPEPADVVVFEDFPPRLLDARVWRLLREVQRSALAPGARFVPAAARVYVAPVESESLATELTLDSEGQKYGLDWSAAREYVANCPHYLTIPRERLLHEGVALAAISFAHPIHAVACGGEGPVRVERRGRVHGLAYWFDLELCDGERLSNRPGEEPGSWGQLFLPLDPPLEVNQGEILRMGVRIDVQSTGAPGCLAWEAFTENDRRRGHEFAGTPLGLRDLLEVSRDSVPELNVTGRLTAEILSLVDGRRTLAEIAGRVARDRAGSVPEAEELVLRHLRGRITPTGPESRGRES